MRNRSPSRKLRTYFDCGRHKERQRRVDRLRGRIATLLPRSNAAFFSVILPQGRRLAVWRLQSRHDIFGLVAVQPTSWSRFPYQTA